MIVNVLCRLLKVTDLIASSLLQNNTDMNGISRKLYQYNDDNSRHLEHLSENKQTFYERDIESYNVEYIRIQKANKILIGEIRDLLTLCFGGRKVSILSFNHSLII